MPGAQQPAQQIDFYRYLRILWRRKWLLIIPLTLCLVVGVIFAMHAPIQYESRAILEAAVTNPYSREGTKRRANVRAEVRDIQETMLSFQEVRDIILGGKVDFGEKIKPDDAWLIEKVYRRIKRSLRVRPASGIHLAVSYRSTDPERNAALVNELVKQYVGEDKRRELKQAKDDMAFYQARYDAQRKRLTEIDVQLREFRQSHPGFRDEIAELYYERQKAIRDETEIREQIQELEASLQELRKERENTDAKLTQVIPGTIPTEVREARRRVEGLQQRFRIMNEKYTPAHRRWQAAKQDLERALTRLKEIDKGEVGEKVVQTVNPRIAGLDEEMEEAKKRLDKLNVKLLNQTKQVAEKSDLLRRSPELLTEKNRLEEERENITRLLDDYGKGLRQADKELGRLSTEAYSAKYKVREYARVSRVPIRETKLKIIGIAAFMGLIVGVGLIVLVEYLDQTFKTVDDVRETLGLPALGVIPAIYTPRDHRRRLWFRVLAFSSGVFIIGVFLLIYFTVGAVQDFISEQWTYIQSQIASM